MNQAAIAPFASWKSPIRADRIAAGSLRLGAVALDEDNVYWLEGRPSEGGRTVLVRRSASGETMDVTPSPYNVRSRVHEYGGGAFTIDGATIFFVDDGDSLIYRCLPGKTPQPVSKENQRRYTEIVFDRPRNRLICVGEDHSNGDPPQNFLVAIALDSAQEQILVSGRDFYASPVLSPDGQHLAWIDWQQPDMPWDATQLRVGKFNEDGSVGEILTLAGGEDESVCHPKWSPNGQLYFVSDRSNWWNLYRCNGSAIEPVLEMEAEFAYPHWVFGLSLYGFVSANELICSYTQQGRWYLAHLNLETQQLQPFSIPDTDIASVQVAGDRVAYLGSSATEPTAVVVFDWQPQTRQVLQREIDFEIDRGYLSTPEAIAFPTEDGQTAYAWFYPPHNQDYQGPSGDRPPLIVKSHGGPTAAATARFSLKIQYWTSRGFAYVDVNYRGSTGYGRQYREQLYDAWGIADVDDCVNAAQFLVDGDRVDGDRLIITGSSAGGYTTLAALAFRDIFKAGASYYGVSDLEILARETHKFEARYFDRLVGKYPEQKAIYEARSPIHFPDRLSCPVIFFQGEEDKVVPPNQAEMMVEALKAKGLPVAYLLFPEEGHGFRHAETIQRTLEAEYYFYSRVLNFATAETINPIDIFNLA